MELTLTDAARQSGASKSTLLRAIRAGRVSARRTEAGAFVIDASELARVFPTTKSDAPDDEAMARRGAPDGQDWRARCVMAEAELRAATALLEIERQRVEEWKAVADRWAQQAERLALAPPPAPAPRRWWWRRSV